MQYLHAIHVKYLGATNHRGSRVKLTSTRFEQSIILNKDYSMNYEKQITQALCNLGFNIIGSCEDGQIILTDTFIPLK